MITRRAPVAFLVAVVASVTLLPSGGAAGAERVDLPTERDILAVAYGAETLLYGARGIETMLPGPVEDEEVVTIGVGPDGAPAEVEVTQRLVVHGLGDFRFKVSGPAQTVEALPDSESEPGLRRGAVLWQGFSADEKVLSSRMFLFPDQEAIRLPLHVTYEQTVDGDSSSEPSSGALAARITIENRSASPVTITSARGDPVEVASALDAMAARLAAGKRPRPGEDGVPATLAPHGGQKDLTRAIPATFSIHGRLSFERGLVEPATVEGGRSVGRLVGAPVIRFGGRIGVGGKRTLEVSLEGVARDLGRPVLEIVARPAPPPAEVARPPGGGTWSELVAAGEVTDTRALWNRIMEISWGIAKLRQYDAYLGNPDPTGPSSTEYRFRLAAPAPPAGPARSSTPGAPTTTPLLAVTAILAFLLLAFAGLLLWSLL
jgi:hypothetical protein